MDAGGARAVQRSRRVRTAALYMAVQNVLVAACLVATLYVYWDIKRVAPEDDVHILFDMIADIPSNTTLSFNGISSKHLMHLADPNRTKIHINCSGPYILYMDICYRSLDRKSSGILQLQVNDRKSTLSTISMSRSNDTCRRFHSIANLRSEEEASLYLYSTGSFKIKNTTVGLISLLGKQCFRFL